MYILVVLLLFLCCQPFAYAQAQVSFKHTTRTSPKYVFAHFMVGNTYPYTIEDWKKDIILAASKGLDAFALNVGKDTWQPDRVADAYTAAGIVKSSGAADFKLFLSFDMSSLPCTTENDGVILRSYVKNYHADPQQLLVNGRTLVSTFAGQDCKFGADSLNKGWTNVLRRDLPEVCFIPAFFVDPHSLSELSSIDGAFSWNSAWPTGDNDIHLDKTDDQFIPHLNGKLYMAGVSPWFFAHYGSDSYNKNWIYRCDDWLWAERWEMLIDSRTSIDLVEVISWNDYGESHYVGPIEGAQPNSQAWTSGYDHQGWLDLIHYYITAYKTGVYPPIKEDRVFLWGRLFPAKAYAPGDAVGRPSNAQYTDDFAWTVIFLKSPARVRMTCGPSNLAADLPAGVSKLRLPLVDACMLGATVSRDEKVVVDCKPLGFEFKTEATLYNFNAFVEAC